MNTLEMAEELARPDREGCVDWLYCDSRGFPTTGVGNLVANVDTMLKLPWQFHNRTKATDTEMRDTWKTVVDAFAKNKPALAYRPLSNLRLPTGYPLELCAERLDTQFIPGVKKLCHDFDSWPEPAQMAIIDMAYNLGLGGLSRFVNFLGACQSRDWETAARECHRATCREKRNTWTAQMFIDAAAKERTA